MRDGDRRGYGSVLTCENCNGATKAWVRREHPRNGGTAFEDLYFEIHFCSKCPNLPRCPGQSCRRTLELAWAVRPVTRPPNGAVADEHIQIAYCEKCDEHPEFRIGEREKEKKESAEEKPARKRKKKAATSVPPDGGPPPAPASEPPS